MVVKTQSMITGTVGAPIHGKEPAILLTSFCTIGANFNMGKRETKALVLLGKFVDSLKSLRKLQGSVADTLKIVTLFKHFITKYCIIM